MKRRAASRPERRASRRGSSNGRVALGLLGFLILPGAPAAQEDLDVPPSPYQILGVRHLRTPVIDVARFCVPEKIQGDLERFAQNAAAEDPGKALEALQRWLGEREQAPPGAVLVAAAMATRAADETTREAALEELQGAILAGGPDEALACARLEAARALLILGRHPEASAQAVQAGRMRARLSNPARVGETADFYRAEARHQAGVAEDAKPLYKVLTRSDDPLLVAAARLRLADASFDAGERAAARAEFDLLVPRAESFGASRSGWALRAAEAALADGDLEVAEDWLRRYLEDPQNPEIHATASIRLADVLALRGQGGESRDLLEEIGKNHVGKVVAQLAAVRAADLGVSRVQSEERLALLRKATLLTHRGVSVYARAVLGHALVEHGDIDEALKVLSRLAYDAPPGRVARHLSADLDSTLQEAARQASRDEDCALLVDRLGERRRLLASRASSPEPFLRLGECYTALGMAAVALDLYRAVSREFGTRLGRDISLQVARAALETGDVAVARATALAGVRQDGPLVDHWRVLLGEAELYDGKWSLAAEAVAGPVQRGEPETERVRAISVLARAAVRMPDPGIHRKTLAEALPQLSDAERQVRPAVFGEAALLTAELHRSAGQLERAVSFYSLASKALPAGAMRAEAAYWLGSLHPDPIVSHAALERAAETPDGGPWSRLARNELGLSRLRNTLGRDAPPASRGTTP